MTTPDMQAGNLADRTIVRVGQEPTGELAYQKLLAETQSANSSLSDRQKSIYARTLPVVSTDQVNDLAIAYASANFKTLDKNGNGALDKDELKARQDVVDKILPQKELTPGLPASMESKLLQSLQQRHSYLRTMTKTGSWWNLNMIDPAGITKDDLQFALKDMVKVRAMYSQAPLRPDIAPDKDLGNLPLGVSELFRDSGVVVKTVNQPVAEALAKQAQDAPVISIAAAVYIPTTKEIFVQNDDFGAKAKFHEAGHAIDDALVPGPKFFSESTLYNQAVDQDLQDLSKQKIDFEKALPLVHVFIQSGLESGKLNESARKELFAELYQSSFPQTADGLRKYFPRTGALVDQTLASQGISRAARQ